MKIVNETAWDSKQLRALVLEGARQFGADTTECVKIVYGRRTGQYSGLATIAVRQGNWVRMRVPRPRFTQGYYSGVEFSPERFAKILIHEFAHNKGVLHKDMLCNSGSNVDWAKAFTVGVKPIKLAKVVDLKAVRYAQTLEKIKERESRLKRLQNSLKKLYAKKKYYERKEVANTSRAETTRMGERKK